VVLNGRFIEMAKEQAQQKILIKRGSAEAPLAYDNKQFLIDKSTKEQHTPTYPPVNGSKRAFHHPALS